MLGLGKDELKELSQNDKVVSKYMDELDKLNRSTLFREYMTEEEDKRKILNSRIKEAEKQGIQRGIQKGIQKGIQQGIQQGIENNKIEIAKNMLNKNMKINVISEITGLTKEEIEKIVIEK